MEIAPEYRHNPPEVSLNDVIVEAQNGIKSMQERFRNIPDDDNPAHQAERYMTAEVATAYANVLSILSEFKIN